MLQSGQVPLVPFYGIFINPLIEGGAPIALNAPKGSRLLEKSKRTTYVAVGYRQWWGIQFLTNRVFASFDGNDSYLLGTEISGVYVRTSIVW
jgi:hypothetical protein